MHCGGGGAAAQQSADQAIALGVGEVCLPTPDIAVPAAILLISCIIPTESDLASPVTPSGAQDSQEVPVS